MEKNTKTGHFCRVTDELLKLYIEKNDGYADSFSVSFREWGLSYPGSRIGDKYNRLKNLILNPHVDDLGESIEDTLRDIANYAILTIMELQNQAEETKHEESVDEGERGQVG